jgi:hypothetical protein
MRIFLRTACFYISTSEGFGKNRSGLITSARCCADRRPRARRHVGRIVWAQVPADQIKAAADAVTGEGDREMNAEKALGPLAGLSFSRGATAKGMRAERSAQKRHAREFGK